MKTRTIVVLLVVVAIISISFAFLLIKAVQTSQERKPTEQTTAKKAAAPNVASSAADAPAQAIDKAKILSMFDSLTPEQKSNLLQAFKKVLRDVPPYVITGTKGYPFALKGEYEKAIQLTNSEITENPAAIDPRYTLAWIYARTGRYDQALFICNDVLEHGSAYNKLRFIKAWVCAKQGKFDDALRTCNEALHDEPTSAQLYYAKGRIMDLSGQYEDAITCYNRAIELKPDYAEAYGFLGLVYTQLGRYDEATKTFREVIKLSRYTPGGYLGLGIVYELAGNEQAAIQEYDNAINAGAFGTNADATDQPLAVKIGLERAMIFNHIGVLDVRLGMYTDAIIAFNLALKAKPIYPEPYRGLTLTYLLLDDRDSALRNYNSLKRMNPTMASSIAAMVEPGK